MALFALLKPGDAEDISVFSYVTYPTPEGRPRSIQVTLVSDPNKKLSLSSALLKERSVERQEAEWRLAEMVHQPIMFHKDSLWCYGFGISFQIDEETATMSVIAVDGEKTLVSLPREQCLPVSHICLAVQALAGARTLGHDIRAVMAAHQKITASFEGRQPFKRASRKLEALRLDFECPSAVEELTVLTPRGHERRVSAQAIIDWFFYKSRPQSSSRRVTTLPRTWYGEQRDTSVASTSQRSAGGTPRHTSSSPLSADWEMSDDSSMESVDLSPVQFPRRISPTVQHGGANLRHPSQPRQNQDVGPVDFFLRPPSAINQQRLHAYEGLLHRNFSGKFDTPSALVGHLYYMVSTSSSVSFRPTSGLLLRCLDFSFSRGPGCLSIMHFRYSPGPHPLDGLDDQGVPPLPTITSLDEIYQALVTLHQFAPTLWREHTCQLVAAALRFSLEELLHFHRSQLLVIDTAALPSLVDWFNDGFQLYHQRVMTSPTHTDIQQSLAYFSRDAPSFRRWLDTQPRSSHGHLGKTPARSATSTEPPAKRTKKPRTTLPPVKDSTGKEVCFRSLSKRGCQRGNQCSRSHPSKVPELPDLVRDYIIEKWGGVR